MAVLAGAPQVILLLYLIDLRILEAGSFYANVVLHDSEIDKGV
jgi:hypothetical protein